MFSGRDFQQTGNDNKQFKKQETNISILKNLVMYYTIYFAAKT